MAGLHAREILVLVGLDVGPAHEDDRASGVSIGAGQTQFTRMLSAASRRESDFVRPVTPNFAAE